MPKINIRQIKIGKEIVYCRIFENKKSGKKCTKCRGIIPEGGEIYKPWDKTFRQCQTGGFCSLKCFEARQKEIIKKRDSNPEQAPKIDVLPGITVVSRASIEVLSPRKGDKLKRRVINYATVIDNGTSGRCEVCKSIIHTGQLHYRIINKEKKLHTTSICSIVCLQDRQ
ncbi:hypothetical protein HGA34_01290 [Candidatus Falkowbacteria bacterium]|nr:hypothetical protein [Candidatus Falkowbacteria bacterium]